MRYVIVHMSGAEINDDLDAHAFGPFDSLDDANDFDADGSPDDTCVKLLCPVVGPAILDMLLSRVEQPIVGVSEGHRAKAN